MTCPYGHRFWQGEIFTDTDFYGHKGRAGGVIHSVKWENQKNGTHTKIKFFDVSMGMGFLRPIFLFFFIFYYFINAIISTLHSSSFIVVYIDIWHIVTVCYVLMCFFPPPPLKSTLLATKNVSPPTVLDLGGWNRHHFVGNWIA